MGVDGFFLEGSVLGRIPWFLFLGGQIVGGGVVYKGLKGLM